MRFLMTGSGLQVRMTPVQTDLFQINRMYRGSHTAISGGGELNYDKNSAKT